MSLLVRRLSIAVLFFFCATALSSAATIVITQDDFDGNTAGVALNPSSMAATIAADPTDPTNMVSCIDIEAGGVWGSYFQSQVDMAAMGISIGDTINYTYDVYIPDDGAGNAVTNAGAQDRVSMIFRWGNNTGGDPNPGNTTLDVDRYNTPGNGTNIPPGSWLTISNSIVIPAANAAGGITTVSSFTPIWSHYDDQDDAVTGTPTAYFDNWSITVDTVPEPTGMAMIFSILCGALTLRRRFA